MHSTMQSRMKSSSHLCWVEFMLTARDKRHHSSFFTDGVFDMKSSRAGIPEVIRIHSSEMIHPSRNVPSRPHILLFVAVGDAYTNISFKCLEKSWQSDESKEYLTETFNIFQIFFSVVVEYSHPRLRANKYSRRVCENWSLCFAK